MAMLRSRYGSISGRYSLNDSSIIPDSQMHILSRILHLKAGEDLADPISRLRYDRRIHAHILKLKSPLKRSALTKLLLLKNPSYAEPCDIHKPLNADFIHQWYKLILLETGIHMNPLRAIDPSTIKDTNCYNLVIWIATYLNKLWYTPAQITEAFEDMLDHLPAVFTVQNNLPAPHQQPDLCEACILTRIGSSLPAILALRGAARSRMPFGGLQQHPRRLRLLRLIEAWLAVQCDQFVPHPASPEKWARIIECNTELADDIYRLRLQVELDQHLVAQQHRRPDLIRRGGSVSESTVRRDTSGSGSAVHRNASTSGSTLAGFGTEQYNQDMGPSSAELRETIADFENDIIDAYSALRSTQSFWNLRGASAQSESTVDAKGPPAEYRLSIPVPSPLFAQKIVPNPHDSTRRSPPLSNTGYNESRYTFDTIANNERVLARSVACRNTTDVRGLGARSSTNSSSVTLCADPTLSGCQRTSMLKTVSLRGGKDDTGRLRSQTSVDAGRCYGG